jgi:IclR family acetate operon transcriptional repressor
MVVRVERMMAVLETIAVGGRPVSVAELQTATGLPRPTCYRMLQSLREHGLVEVVDAGRYQLGVRLRRLAMLGWSDGDVVTATAPTLTAAADELSETVFLSRLRDEGVEIVHVETPSDPTVSYVHPGLGYRPRHACSCAKAILAFSGTDVRDRMLDAPLRAYTEYTKTSSAAVRSELERVRSSGFAECVEEIEAGVASVAAPIWIDAVGPVFSVGVIGPIRRFDADRRARLGAELLTMTEHLASVLNLQPDAALVR